MYPADSVLGVDVDSYQPVDSLSRYGDRAILDKLPIRAAAALPADLQSFVASLHSNIALWTGARGLLGRDHASHRTHIKPAPPDEAEQLHARYIELRRSLPSHEPLPFLAAELGRQVRAVDAVAVANSLSNASASFSLQYSVSASVGGGSGGGRGRGRSGSRDEADVANANANPVSTTSSATTIATIITSNNNNNNNNINANNNSKDKSNISNNFNSATSANANANTITTAMLPSLDARESAVAARAVHDNYVSAAARVTAARDSLIRRLAILRKLYGDDNPAGECAAADAASREASFRFFRAVCFFADARTGRALLYDVEASLKRILQHLEDAMTVARGPVDSVTVVPNSDSGADGTTATITGASTSATMVTGSKREENSSTRQTSSRTRIRRVGGGNTSAAANHSSHHDVRGGGPGAAAVTTTTSTSSSPASSSPRGVGGGQTSGTGPGVDFRLRHVRRSWAAVEATFCDAVPYILHTSLRAAATSTERAGVDAKNGSGPRGGRKTSVFAEMPTLLGSAAKLEMAHPLSRRSRVRALHRVAARAYREINLVYDIHEMLVTEAALVVERRHCDNMAATEALVAAWEQALAKSEDKLGDRKR